MSATTAQQAINVWQCRQCGVHGCFSYSCNAGSTRTACQVRYCSNVALCGNVAGSGCLAVIASGNLRGQQHRYPLVCATFSTWQLALTGRHDIACAGTHALIQIFQPFVQLFWQPWLRALADCSVCQDGELTQSFTKTFSSFLQV